MAGGRAHKTRGGICREAGPRLQVSRQGGSLSSLLLSSPLTSLYRKHARGAEPRRGPVGGERARSVTSSPSNPAVVSQSELARRRCVERVLSQTRLPSLHAKENGQILLLPSAPLCSALSQSHHDRTPTLDSSLPVTGEGPVW